MTLPAVIVAGGAARRMGGGDKCLLPLGPMTVLDHILGRIAPQAGPLMINSNSPPDKFLRFGLPVRPDSVDGLPGPLAGILSAMLWAREFDAAYVVTVPGDTPFLPDDLVAKLAASAPDGGVAVAACGDKIHPVMGLWPIALAGHLRADLENGARRVHSWLATTNFVSVPFDDADAFCNLNTVEDWQNAHIRLGSPGLPSLEPSQVPPRMKTNPR
jgi:molybdopterin-guanine dinucleotide biosynthesis protein A